MKVTRSDWIYYAVTLMADEQGRLGWTAHTDFAGFVDGNPRHKVRVAAEVSPDKMIALWREIGQSYVAVNDAGGLYIFLRLGGNALVAKEVAKKWQPEWLQPREVVTLGYGGFVYRDGLPDTVLKRAATPRHRMRILKRDGFRCRLCGRNPDNYTDVVLHLHHIRPWGAGGVTHDKNLITLCHTCHNGLDPHEDHSLFDLVGSGPKAMADEVINSYRLGVLRWRSKVREIFEAAGGTGGLPTSA